MTLTKHNAPPYWDEGMKNPFRWYKKGVFKRWWRKKVIRDLDKEEQKEGNP